MNTHMHAKHAYIHTCSKHAYTHTRSKHAYTHTCSKHAYMHTHLHIHMKMEKEKSHPIIFFGLNPPKLHLKGWGHPMAKKALHVLYGPASNTAPLSPTLRFFQLTVSSPTQLSQQIPALLAIAQVLQAPTSGPFCYCSVSRESFCSLPSIFCTNIKSMRPSLAIFIVCGVCVHRWGDG